MEGKHLIYRSKAVERREAGTDSGKKIIRGYAAVFEELTDRVGYYKEKIDKAAFDNCDFSECKLVLGHDFNNLLGAYGINLRVETDDIGLWFEVELPETTLANDVYTLVEMGILTGTSFYFPYYQSVIETDYEKQTDTIKSIPKVYEITITPIPAYPQTVATAQTRTSEVENNNRAAAEAELDIKIKKLEAM